MNLINHRGDTIRYDLRNIKPDTIIKMEKTSDHYRRIGIPYRLYKGQYYIIVYHRLSGTLHCTNIKTGTVVEIYIGRFRDITISIPKLEQITTID